MPTAFPKASPSEVVGLLVLLNGHKGSEDVARLADDLDLEIDEILPALDYAELLTLLQVKDGRATLTDSGKTLLAASIRERKAMLRDQLKRTTLFKALIRALEGAPERTLTEDEVVRLIDFTTAPADEFVQNILNWGRYAELFRFDSVRRVVQLVKPRATRAAPAANPPNGGGAMASPATNPAAKSSAATKPTTTEKLSSVAVAFA
jgi:NitT/TauT family transport system ATP-binding protein